MEEKVDVQESGLDVEAERRIADWDVEMKESELARISSWLLSLVYHWSPSMKKRN